jgi:hypothetical protein
VPCSLADSLGALFGGIAVIRERDLGRVHEQLPSPACHGARVHVMGVGRVLTMPRFCASSAIHALDPMPQWLRSAARFIPPTYLVDALRGLMVAGGPAFDGWGTDFSVSAAVFTLLMACHGALSGIGV